MVPVTEMTPLAYEEALTTTHQVEVEAERASKARAPNVGKKRTISEERLSDRLTARRRVKRLRCLQKSPAFASLAEASVAQIVDVMEFSTVGPGHVLCKEGDTADRMFVLVSGTCDVHAGDCHIATLNQFDVFGESALFPNTTGACVRSATVTAHVAASVLVLAKPDLDALVKSGVMQPGCVQALELVARERQATRMLKAQKRALPAGAGDATMWI